MTASAQPTIHASAVLVGTRAVLIRGAAGSGKSRLALALIEAGRSGLLPFVRLVADDRTPLEAVHGRLLVPPGERPPGLLEVRGEGVGGVRGGGGLGRGRLPFEPVAVVGLVVDLDAADAERLPPAARIEVIAGVRVPRLAVAPMGDPLRQIVAFLTSVAADAV